MRRFVLTFCVLLAAAACTKPATEAPAAKTAPAAKKLGIRPNGDTEISPDMSQVPPELQKVFALHRRAHRRARGEPAEVDSAAEHLELGRRHSRVGRDGEGLLRRARAASRRRSTTWASPSTARPATRWSTPSATRAPRRRCSSTGCTTRCRSRSRMRGSRRRSKARLVEQAPYKKVLIGRGATNSKGPQMSQLNAFRAIKAVNGKLPGQPHLRGRGRRRAHGHRPAQVRQGSPGPARRRRRDVSLRQPGPSGGGGYGGGSEGCVYVELTTSGKSWGRGPTVSDIHGCNKRGVDSPAWRHIKMLASLVSDDGNTPMIDGFFERHEAARRPRSRNAELKAAAQAPT